MAQEILQLIDKRRRYLKKDKEKYDMTNKEIRNKCRQAKEDRTGEQCR